MMLLTENMSTKFNFDKNFKLNFPKSRLDFQKTFQSNSRAVLLTIGSYEVKQKLTITCGLAQQDYLALDSGTEGNKRADKLATRAPDRLFISPELFCAISIKNKVEKIDGSRGAGTLEWNVDCRYSRMSFYRLNFFHLSSTNH